jgi:ABC-type transport system involved in Fe-S cluster assembly fused permease/ATPase subunit
MISTPSGEFVQLLSKVFRALDPLIPGLYGGVIPIYVETITAVVFVLVVYGPIALVQLGLVLVYSVVAYSAAKAKAARNQDMMKAFLSEWGKIIAAAGSYERAHFFDNVHLEVSKTRGSFEMMGTKLTKVMRGEHYESMRLMGISLLITGGFVPLIVFTVDTTPDRQISLIAYYILFLGTLDGFALGISNLRTAVYEYQTFDEFITRASDVGDVAGAVALEPTANPTIEFQVSASIRCERACRSLCEERPNRQRLHCKLRAVTPTAERELHIRRQANPRRCVVPAGRRQDPRPCWFLWVRQIDHPAPPFTVLPSVFGGNLGQWP